MELTTLELLPWILIPHNMEQQEWIDGVFEETDTDYTIAGVNILYKKETEYLKKGVKLLCDKLHPSSVLEFGFGKGWTASEFQEQGIKRHVILEPNKEVYQTALDWKDKYDTDIEILNIFSWDYNSDEKFDLVYDDRFYLKNDKQLADYPIFFQVDGNNYVQSLSKYGEYKSWQ